MFRTRVADNLLGEDFETREKRRHRRHKVRLAASLHPIDVYQDVVINDASRSGLMGESDIEVEVGQTLFVSLDELTFVSGTVRWTKGRQFGLDLDDPLNLPGLAPETDHGSEIGHKPRADRVKLDLPARVHFEQSTRPVTIRDLSRHGMAMEAGEGLLKGQQVLVRIRDRPLIPGRIQWNGGGRIGISSNAEVPLLQLLYSDD
ncbi:PilZ domain-containing protein [Sphingomonas natans]|uniref:PilZ domain-containing protein n=1 Tax=Sphingomonas natans TaxID=3063330 RepID=UPI0026E36B21|nr:PilZ domain-containing protein [Sphingomonas sp. BIUV-7]